VCKHVLIYGVCTGGATSRCVVFTGPIIKNLFTHTHTHISKQTNNTVHIMSWDAIHYDTYGSCSEIYTNITSDSCCVLILATNRGT
jgi:hypothetical protein